VQNSISKTELHLIFVKSAFYIYIYIYREES